MCNFNVCGEECLPFEDATLVDSFLNGCPMLLFFNLSKHIRCSPSRAQYILDGVVDDRPAYDKRLLSGNERIRRERLYKRAYAEALDEVRRNADKWKVRPEQVPSI